jgi:cyanophycinase-like exopeptidase
MEAISNMRRDELVAELMAADAYYPSGGDEANIGETVADLREMVHAVRTIDRRAALTPAGAAFLSDHIISVHVNN